MTGNRPLAFILARIAMAALVLGIALAAWSPAQAQFFDETLEQDELFVEDEDQFFESRGDDLGGPGQEQDFTEGDKFVDETGAPGGGGGVSRTSRKFQLTLERDRDDLPFNIAWGAGTGLLIGGWFALIGEGDNRQTQQAIGIGIVAGILLGTFIGTRSVFDPSATRAISSVAPPPSTDGGFTPLVSLNPRKPSVGFRLLF